ncbi:MAG: hypothetical protein ACRYFW_10810 [Janthinobacterium lividum]
MTAGRYERGRAGLPWGWWLRAGPVGLEDGEGGVWPSVRAAFWEGRLGMRSGHVGLEQQELLVRVLTDMDAEGHAASRLVQDVFEGNAFFWRFNMCWLASIGMTIAADRGTGLERQLSDEGRAAMLMLLATQDPEWIDLPMRGVVDTLARASLGDAHDAREAALCAFERGMTRLRHVFARERAGRAYLVTLTSIDPVERMPIRRIVWSASFWDAKTRDDLFAWLAERVHRWDDWGAKVRSLGARALSDHLLAMLVAEPIGGPPLGGVDGDVVVTGGRSPDYGWDDEPACALSARRDDS